MSQRTCPTCAAEFTTPTGRGRPRIYCSKACNRKASAARQVSTCEKCERPVRAKGLCGSHYNQTYAPNRHKRATVRCTYCAATLERFPAADRRPFCDYTCRDLYMLAAGEGAWAARRPRRRRHNQPSWPDWMGKSSPIARYDCAECAAAFYAKPNKRRGDRAFCSAKCRNAFKGRGRRNIKKAKRLRIFERDGYVCWLCDKPCGPAESFPDALAPTIDHITPRNHGGTDDEDNLACAHFICNSKRQDSWSFPEVAAVA